MRLRVLNVAYPVAPAGRDAVGGAEQVLARLDSALVMAGHESTVLGCEGSKAHGELVEAFPIPDAITDDWKEHACREYRSRIEKLIDERPIDLVHLHGVDFHRYLPARNVPVLVTLHLPVSYYPANIFNETGRNVWLHCVSWSQHETCPRSERLLGPIENGVPIPSARPRRKHQFALSLGRICPEKGFHLAIEACRRASIPFALAGEVFPYEAHLSYFAQEIRPRLNRRCRYIGPLRGALKTRYLQHARCVLISSLVPETSSLAAMEALAAGTPVIGFARGALPSIIEDGRTGFLCNSVEEMAAAIERVHHLAATDCQAAARERFSAERMSAIYLARYQELVARFQHEQQPAFACV